MISRRIWDVKVLIGGLFQNEFWERLIRLTKQARKILGRMAASKTIQQMKEWNCMLGSAPEDV